MDNKFKYQPEINYESINERDSEKVIPLLDPFKKGVIKALEPHILNADGLAKFFTSGQINAEFRAETRPKTKEIDDKIMEIIRGYSELESDIQDRQLDTLAHRDYYNYFSNQEIDNSKIEFIKLLKVYELLTVYNNLLKENWTWLAKFYESIKVNSGNRPILEQILMFKIYPRLGLTELTDLFLRRLRIVLRIYEEESKAGKLHVRGRFSSLIHYTNAAVFIEDLDSVIAEDENTNINTPEDETASTTPQIDTCIKNPYFLDSRGNELFNQSFFYTLEIKKEKVQVDEQKIKSSVYIETHMGAEQKTLRQDLIRRFISQAGSKDRVSEYVIFISNYCSFTKDVLLKKIPKLHKQDAHLFLYHLGPIYFLKVMMHDMRESRTGFIHRRLKKDQMLRELPLEYLKFTLKDWWNLEVYQKLSRQERNSRDQYDKIIRKVTQKWQAEQPKVLMSIRQEPYLLRAMKLHDLNTLGKFIETEVSYLLYVVLLRFLGRDFLYLPVHKISQKSNEASA